MQERLCLYFRKLPEKDKWFYGDRILRKIARMLFKKNKPAGVEKVFINLCKGLELLKIPYLKNLPFNQIKPTDRVVVLGTGKYSLSGYNVPNKIIAGIGLMTHPSEWPLLCHEYPVVKYLQHSTWAKNVYIPYYSNQICDVWPSGIETEKWKPTLDKKNKFDILIYNKIRWEKDSIYSVLKNPISDFLNRKEISFKEIIYGHYTEKEYHKLLRQCKAMIFLCEHESQGFACCEALSMNIPVFAWDQGYCLDPNRFKWNDPVIPATSVPFFDERCGMKFKDIAEFTTTFETFWNLVTKNRFSPRDYIMENLTLEKSAERMVAIIEESMIVKGS